MPPKRPSEDEPTLIHKIQRIEHGVSSSPPQRLPNNDFSSSVKRKLADSKRTGQACDRCKIRKIRCDGRPEGCTPCEQNRTPCQTTDRITGRATVRGHAEAMESENAYLRRQIADLQDQLKENGIEPRLLPAYNGLQPPQLPWSSSSRADDSQSWPDAQRRTSTTPHPAYTPASATEKYEYRPLPEFKHGSIGDNYLGVGAGDSLLSHIRGTSLSVFGTEIDITDYMSDEAEYENSVMSYSSLVKICLGGEQVDPVSLPPYAQLKEYAVWYLRSLNPYTMLVHKPAFMDLIWKFGNDPNFRPTPSETVTVHMMLATIQYQIATRNSQGNALMEESHRHFRYALSFYKQLLGHHKLEDLQALTMICHHLRNFPKPGAAWIMTSTTYLFALELGLHRSVKNWTEGTGNMTKLEIEMRKRIFWTLNALQVNLNGKLGRPMPISNEDIDVEFPEPMNDCLPEEEANLDSFHQCSFQVGIQIAKYTVLEVDLYKMIYSVRYSPSVYVERLKRLEAGIKQWKEELPYELRDPSHALQDDQIFTLYLEYWYQAYHLLLHHPAVCRSTEPSIVDSNLDKCLEASQKMLQNCNTLMLKKSLDIPWINTVVYIAAMFTTLFISSNRKEQLSSVDMERLKNDMTTWVSVLGECDHFLGSGDNLKNAIAKIAEQSLRNINEGIIKRAATESLVHVEMQTPQQAKSGAPIYDSRNYQVSYSTAPAGHTDPALTAHSSSYTTMTGGASHPYDLGTTISAPPQTGTAFDHQQSYSSDDPGMTSTHAAALAAASGGTSQPGESYTYANAHGQTSNNGAPAYSTNGFTPHDWRQWTRTYMQPQPLGQPGEYLNTATTLMALGRDGGSQNPGNNMPGSLDNTAVQGHTGHVHWPELAFPGAANGHGHMSQQ